ncbi:Auxin efflux carrier transmembrane protein [Mycena kentingensis (nom. inval.)]|nr:Auxin efflux carrier transmembrane protein [Mycena kentingensis (nom. inval.)]
MDLPPEMERVIFELAAWNDTPTTLSLLLVAHRVRIWIEPLLYRVLNPSNIEGFDALISTGKPASFTQHLLVNTVYVEPEKLNRIIRSLPNLTSLAVWISLGSQTDFFDGLGAGGTPPLARLSLGCLQSAFPNPASIGPLRQLTHLELYDYSSCSDIMLPTLASLPSLTHLAFGTNQFSRNLVVAALQDCLHLRVVAIAIENEVIRVRYRDPGTTSDSQTRETVEADIRDPRFCVVQPRYLDFGKDWLSGAWGGRDFWVEAEERVAMRTRECEIQQHGWGIIVAGGWGNWGDIPNAVVLGITSAAPFNGTADQNLGVAYLSGFILVSMLTFFPMGGNQLVGLDYAGGDMESEALQEKARRRRRLLIYKWPMLLARLVAMTRGRVQKGGQIQDVEKSPSLAALALHHPDSASPTVVEPPTSITSSSAADISSASSPSRSTSASPTSTPTATPNHKRSTRFRTFLRNLFLPSSVAILASTAIALIPPLKALFVSDSSTAHVHMPSPPDGQPPLAFLIDAANFIGAASVPMGLVCLGSALARLPVPRGRDAWRALPTGAILGLAVGKMLVAPVLGILLCKGLIRAGVIDGDDKVLQFVCMFFSGLPTSTTQVFVTQVYSGTGSAELLSAFLIPQYVLMLPSMTAVTAYLLQSLF